MPLSKKVLEWATASNQCNVDIVFCTICMLNKLMSLRLLLTPVFHLHSDCASIACDDSRAGLLMRVLIIVSYLLIFFTCTDFLVVGILLRVARNAALEAVLPELCKPRVPGVGVQAQLQEVVVKRHHFLRLQLHSDAAVGFLLISLHHLVAICPPVAFVTKRRREAFRGFLHSYRRQVIIHTGAGTRKTGRDRWKETKG